MMQLATPARTSAPSISPPAGGGVSKTVRVRGGVGVLPAEQANGSHVTKPQSRV